MVRFSLNIKNLDKTFLHLQKYALPYTYVEKCFAACWKRIIKKAILKPLLYDFHNYCLNFETLTSTKAYCNKCKKKFKFSTKATSNFHTFDLQYLYLLFDFHVLSENNLIAIY